MAKKYIYRLLTPEERLEIVRQRQMRGYPMHAPPHPFRHPGHYLITAVNFEHAPVMSAPERRTSFEEQLLKELDQAGADIGAWVILPNHYHVLVGVTTLDQISKTLRHLHGSTAYAWNLADGLTNQRKVWFNFHDRVIRNEHHYFRALNYIHYNPVHHRYADSPYDWPWSSVENYLHTEGQGWLRAMWHQHPPGNFGDGWDD